ARCGGVNLRVDERGLVVSAPERISEQRLHGVLHDAAQWVLAKLAHWQEWQARRPAPLQLRDGAVLEFLGMPLPLALRAGRYSAARDMFSLLVSVPKPEDEACVRMQVNAWYHDEALRHFPGRIAHYAEQLTVRARKLTVSEAKTRWGSCNAHGEIRLSWRLMQAPPHLIDYVVAHELAHLRELNHSPRFWELVASVYPQYRDARKELDSLTQRYMAL
ncbi:MAG: M48 family metallopeptidase, partial [Pseudomonadota bacterium]